MVVALLVLAALGMLWLGTRIAPASAAERPDRAGLPWVMVHRGDTLWGIAGAVAPEGDPAETVRRIMDLDGMPGPTVRPGDRLHLAGGLAG
ncbi:hypothetical protein GCM10010156_27930 [Planobispora rosea]|uniref:LysM domain-containing protein n=1 Tax=Planobispora rosea TaxID=35762 RepID=A0A8J3S872_PLARO|nr:hypothetical protein GCM10010156_27930 [Planobispora rosea]GIH85153.1 hypothetical protein Pro02_35610 [Planobispora rosea]